MLLRTKDSYCVASIIAIFVIPAMSLISCKDFKTGDSLAGIDDSIKKALAVNREEDFLMDAIDNNETQVELLKAGIDKGTDEELKTGAIRMLSEHQNIATELKSYADKTGITIPVRSNSDLINLYNREGYDWDEEWADELGDQYQTTINRFERADKRIDDPEIKGIIAKTLPTLRSNLDFARKLERKLDAMD